MANKPPTTWRTLPARTGLAWLFIMCLGLAGCSGLYVDPGPQPARLVVHAQDAVTRQMVYDALVSRANLKYEPFSGAEDITGPLWDLRAFLPRPDGQLVPLRPVQKVENVNTYDFDGQASFLAPPGRHEVVFLLECSMRHESLDGPTPVVEYIYVVTRKWSRTLDFTPGGQVEAPAPAPPARP